MFSLYQRDILYTKRNLHIDINDWGEGSKAGSDVVIPHLLHQINISFNINHNAIAGVTILIAVNLVSTIPNDHSAKVNFRERVTTYQNVVYLRHSSE